jgi:hypothetical protein
MTVGWQVHRFADITTEEIDMEPHLAHQTTYTRTGKLNMLNRKPFRTAAQKAEARRTARLFGGTHVSGSPVSYHAKAKQPNA